MLVMSGLPPIATVARTSQIGGFVPRCDISYSCTGGAIDVIGSELVPDFDASTQKI